MNGPKACLKRDLRVIVDTHVLEDAAQKKRDGATSDSVTLMEMIVRLCSKLVWTPGQARESSRPLRRLGYKRLDFRFPVQIPMFKELDESGKLLQLATSRITKFSEDERNAFHARGHDDVSDDIPLYEAARAVDRVVITEDENLLRRRENLRASIGVETLSVAEALATAEPARNHGA